MSEKKIGPLLLKKKKIQLHSHQQLTGDTAYGKWDSQIQNVKLYPHTGRLNLKMSNPQNPTALFLADQQIHASL